jgi:SSS family transporter
MNIHPIDSAIVVCYLAAVLAFGLWVGRGQRDSADYFLGGRALPWWALLLSIVATETSTVTFLSLPGISGAAGGDLTFLQITFGYIAGRFLIVRFLLPLYFQGQAFTAYETLERRFGVLSRRAASTLFLVTRNVSDALRLFLTALVLQIVLGLDLSLSVVVLGVITIVYTLVGGARSVIWNDCIQFVVYMVGAAAALAMIARGIPGGWGELVQFAVDNDKLRVLDLDLRFTGPTMTFWAGLVGGAFLTMATHGTDQLMVQRYLSARNRPDAARALGLSGFIVLAQFAVFLFIGVALAAFAERAPAGAGLAQSGGDRLFASFIVGHMPVGLAGLTLASVFAAAMSTLSSSLNSSATALINDVYLPLKSRTPGPNAQLRAGRLATAGFGAVQVAIAVAVGAIGTTESTVANVLKIAGFASGPVLGIYLLARFAPGVRQPAALSGFVIGVAGLSWLALGTDLYWPWYAAAGALLTALAGRLVQTVMNSKRRPQDDES